VRNLNLAQRVVLVVGLAALCVAIDGYFATRSSGWFGYAPNTDVVFEPDGGKTRLLVVRAALAVAWAAAGLVILRSPKQ